MDRDIDAVFCAVTLAYVLMKGTIFAIVTVKLRCKGEKLLTVRLESVWEQEHHTSAYRVAYIAA